jgi:pimeloyl-ACP methyl ester carboxylesterase
MGNKSSSERNLESNEDSIANSDVEYENAVADSNQNSLSYYEVVKQSYQALVNAIIRPPRSEYTLAQLGPQKFVFCERRFIRKDFELFNDRGLKFVCSMWEPYPEDRPAKELPVVIYMHGNSSSRCEALSILSLVLSLGATLFAFDFCGSGASDGEYVSLGAYEKNDLLCVIEYLRCTRTTSSIALWGRSMGAATALFYSEADPSIAGMVLDSAFADLTMLAEEIVEKGREQGLFAPGVLVSLVLRSVRSSVQKTAGFDIKLLSPLANAHQCFIPALFVAGEDDNFVSKTHSQKIFNKYAGDKNIVIVEGDHNSARPRFLFDSSFIFLKTVLQTPDSWALEEGQHYFKCMPWSGGGGSGMGMHTSGHTTGRGSDVGMVRTSEEEDFVRDMVASGLLDLDDLDVGMLTDTGEDYCQGEGGDGNHSSSGSFTQASSSSSIEAAHYAGRSGHVNGDVSTEMEMQQSIKSSVFNFLGGSGGNKKQSSTNAHNKMSAASPSTHPSQTTRKPSFVDPRSPMRPSTYTSNTTTASAYINTAAAGSSSSNAGFNSMHAGVTPPHPKGGRKQTFEDEAAAEEDVRCFRMRDNEHFDQSDGVGLVGLDELDGLKELDGISLDFTSAAQQGQGMDGGQLSTTTGVGVTGVGSEFARDGSAAGSEGKAEDSAGSWECTVCTLVNYYSRASATSWDEVQVCEVCGVPREG